MSDPRDSATREEWNRQWKASRPRERREMIRLARKKYRERNPDRPNRADYRYRSQTSSIFWAIGLFALTGWIGLITSAITGDFAISFAILVVLLTVAAALAFYGLRQQRYGFTVLAAAVMLGGIGLSRLTE